MAQDPVDVLVVGAGPTGLTLAAQLAAHGVTPRLIERRPSPGDGSRALTILPRTLEVLAGFGVAEQLVALGKPATQMCIHSHRRRQRTVPLFDCGLTDTAYPFLLILSQVETERALYEHLRTAGVTLERGVELVDLDPAEDALTAILRHAGGQTERMAVRYVAGCDGAHSTVRRLAGIDFSGSAYPQTFLQADIEADGLEPGTAHVFLSASGMLFFVPLGAPATWRMGTMRPPTDLTPPDAPVTLAEVQALATAYTGGQVQVRDPAWLIDFQVHQRAASRYRAGRLFLAGDAAHLYSPAGAQGMNTGVQDAINLGWKLAYVLRGLAPPSILGSYDPERAPIGRSVLRAADRAFKVTTSDSWVLRTVRSRLVPALLPLVLRHEPRRGRVFRTISQLSIHYRDSPLSTDGPNPPQQGCAAGERLPDATVVKDGQSTTLHNALAQPGWHLLQCGSANWPSLPRRHANLIGLHQLTSHDLAGSLRDPDGHALSRLGVSDPATAYYLIRPDGHVGYRAGGRDLSALVGYLEHWIS